MTVFFVIGEIAKCSGTLVCCMWFDPHTTPDLINLETLSLKGKKEEMRVEERQTNRTLRCG